MILPEAKPARAPPLFPATGIRYSIAAYHCVAFRFPGFRHPRIDFGGTRCTNADMSEASTSDTPLRASFQVKLNGESVTIATVGQAYRFITRLNTVEWMEFQALHNDARAALEAAAGDAMMIVQATNAVRALLARAKLL
jgi:hypothetical protein